MKARSFGRTHPPYAQFSAHPNHVRSRFEWHLPRILACCTNLHDRQAVLVHRKPHSYHLTAPPSRYVAIAGEECAKVVGSRSKAESAISYSLSFRLWGLRVLGGKIAVYRWQFPVFP